MDKHNRPKAFGVFKPVDHVLMAFHDAEDLIAAQTALGQQGFNAQDLTTYEPQEMLHQTEEDMRNAGLLATVGQELNLVKAHHALAETGCSFLVVHTPKDEQVRQVTDVALRTHATSAQHYGRFIIEELISTPRGNRQVFESHDRGLDVKVSGPAKPS